MTQGTGGVAVVALPHLKRALDLLGLDCGADVNRSAIIPPEWEIRARLADEELAKLTPEQMIDFTQGEHTAQQAVAALAPAAAELLEDAFDGPLSNIVFRPWTSIYDARNAERRVKP